jgi:hypothetical protein
MKTATIGLGKIGSRLATNPVAGGADIAGSYDRSVFAVDGTPSVSFIEPDVALIHWYWAICGVRSSNASLLAPYVGNFTWVVVTGVRVPNSPSTKHDHQIMDGHLLPEAFFSSVCGWTFRSVPRWGTYDQKISSEANDMTQRERQHNDGTRSNS